MCAYAHVLAGPGDPAHITIAVNAERRHPPRTESDAGQAIEFETEAKSEFGLQIAVDLEADANLDQGWSRPNHGASSRTIKTSARPRQYLAPT